MMPRQARGVFFLRSASQRGFVKDGVFRLIEGRVAK
jgi:hypothetical protein